VSYGGEHVGPYCNCLAWYDDPECVALRQAQASHLRTKRVLAVEAALPEESAAALARFTTMNPHWRGAHWADVLDVLYDSDSNLDVTEPIYEALRGLPEVELALVGYVTLTLLYAHQEAPEAAVVADKVKVVLPHV
jgi:hypothetical protein